MKGKPILTVAIENAHIVSLFLFQYSLTMMIMYFFDPTIIVMGSTLILVGISTLINRFRFKYNKCYVYFLFILLLIISKYLLVDGSKLYSVIVYIEIALPVTIIMANGFNFNKFIQFSYKMAYINFFSIALYPFMGEFAYMRFGYGMLLTAVFMYIKVFASKDRGNIFDIILLVVSFGMMLLYGSRGATFSFFLLVALDRFLIKRKEYIKNTSALVISAGIYYLFDSILTILQNFAIEIGVRTYSLSKFRMQLNSGMETAASGRFEIYRDAIEKIYDNWVFGVPMTLGEEGYRYAHNLFLQAGLDFGALGIIVMVLFVLFMLCKIWYSSKMWNQCYMLAILFSIAIGRLMFSSIIWRRPEFWMLMMVSLIELDNNVKTDL